MGMFDGMMGGSDDNSAISVLKDLQNPENIEMKTDLNMSQIKVLTQIKLYYLLNDTTKTAQEAVEETLEYYMRLLCSVGRKSREEITSSVKQLKASLMEDQNIAAMMGGKK